LNRPVDRNVQYSGQVQRRTLPQGEAMKTISLRYAMVPFVFSLVLAACSSDDSSNNGGSDYCSQSCAKAEALHCPNDVAGSCASECQQLSMMAMCKTQFDALMSCSATAMYACDSNGEAKVQGCDTQESAYFMCVFGGGLPDGGGD
jgi:hypothetical protein